MTTTMNVGGNGKVRHSLVNEIDRLDRMLDGLAEGLNEAVADAVKAAVGTAEREAAQVVLTEVLTNPEIRSRLTGSPTATAPVREAVVKPSLRQRLSHLWQGVRACVAGLGRWCGSGVRRLPMSISNLWRRMVRGLASLWNRRLVVTQFKYQLLTAVGIGTSVAVGAWFAGPHVSALISGIGGFGTSVAVQGWLWMRKAFGAPALANA